MYSDCSNFDTDVDGLAAEVDATDAVVAQEPENSVLVLSDIRGTVGSSEALAVFKASAARLKKYVRKTAVVGVEGGLRRLLLEAVSRFSGRELVAFDDVERAKDWLIE